MAEFTESAGREDTREMKLTRIFMQPKKRDFYLEINCILDNLLKKEYKKRQGQEEGQDPSLKSRAFRIRESIITYLGDKDEEKSRLDKIEIRLIAIEYGQALTDNPLVRALIPEESTSHHLNGLTFFHTRYPDIFVRIMRFNQTGDPQEYQLCDLVGIEHLPEELRRHIKRKQK